MKKNRKKADTYRFNGHPFLDAGSIHSVEIAELEARIKQFESKLADANDPDDKKWTARWLERFRKELDKKQARRSLKQREARDRRRTPIKPARSIDKKISSRKFFVSIFSSSKRELRLSFQFSSIELSPESGAIGKGVRLNTYLDSIGPVWSLASKPSTPRGLPAPRSNALTRSRNSPQCTQRLSIQNEGGSRITGRCRRVCDSSFLWTCHWGGCSKNVPRLCRQPMDFWPAPWESVFPHFRTRKTEGHQGQFCLPRPFCRSEHS